MQSVTGECPLAGILICSDVSMCKKHEILASCFIVAFCAVQDVPGEEHDGLLAQH